MKRICFGTFIKVLLLCKDPLQDVKQHKFGQTLISSVNELHGRYVDETTISNYARCERSLASEITTATASANRDYVVDYFEKNFHMFYDTYIISWCNVCFEGGSRFF